MSYYKKELSSVSDIDSVKFFNDYGASTKTMNLTLGCIEAIREFLNEKEVNIIINSDLSIYKKALALNLEFDTHCSDLYLYVNDTTKKLIENYQFKCNVTTFKSATDGRMMFDIPFAYDNYKQR